MIMKQTAYPIAAEPLFTNDEWFARVHLFDDGIRQMTNFLNVLPNDEVRREFWIFISFICRVTVDYEKDPNSYPKQYALFQALTGNLALKIYQPFFDWVLSEMEKSDDDFQVVLIRYWQYIHQSIF